MADENIANAPSIDIFKDDMFVWILDPNSSPQTNSFLLSKFIQERRITFAVDVGAANAYEIVLKSTLTAYVQGQEFTFLASAANTGATTLKVDALGTLPVLRRDGTPLQAGDIPIGSMNTVQFDGTDFQLMTSQGGVSVTNLQNSDNTFDVDTGAADVYVITLSPAITSYIKGQLFSFEAINANLTTTPTINVNGNGAQTIINRDGSALLAGDIPANALNIIQYDGTNFQLMTTLAGGGGAAWIPDLTTGTGAAVQNTATSDITAQTGTNTFDGLKWTIDITGRASTGEVNFLHFEKTDTGTTSVFKVDINGKVTIATGSGNGLVFGDGDTGIFETSDDNLSIQTISLNAITIDSVQDVRYFSDLRMGTDNKRIIGFANRSFLLDGGAGEVGSPTYSFIGDANTGAYQTAANEYRLAVNGIDAIIINSSQIFTTLSQLKTTASTTLAAINIGSFAGDPSVLADFDIWGNSSTGKLRARENGVSVDVIGVVSTTTVTISSAQILDIADTPIELIAAPGVNKIIVILSGYYSYIFNTTAYSGASNDTRMQAFYSGTIKNATGGFIETNSGSSSVALTYNGSDHTGTTSDFENKAIDFTNNGVDPTLGDGTVEVTLSFIIMDV